MQFPAVLGAYLIGVRIRAEERKTGKSHTEQEQARRGEERRDNETTNGEFPGVPKGPFRRERAEYCFESTVSEQRTH